MRLLVSVFAVVLAACMNTEPIVDVPVNQALVVDAGTVDAATACLTCVQRAGDDGCLDAYRACVSTPKCEALFVCGASEGCYAAGGDLTTCMPTCGAKAGVASQSDPAVGPFLEAYLCTRTKCADAC
jgi:hypothetical protein